MTRQSAGRPPKSSQQLSKTQILQAALPLLRAGDEDALTFRVLAQKLNVTPMAVKYHVGSKRDLMRDLVDLAFKGTLDGVDRGAAKDRARNILRAYYERAVLNTNLLRAILNDVELMSSDLFDVTNALQACTQDMNDGDDTNVLLHLLVDYTHGFVLSASSGENNPLTVEDFLRGVDWVLDRAADERSP